MNEPIEQPERFDSSGREGDDREPGDVPVPLSPAQRDAILELGSHGSGGLFDPQAMSELFTMRIVEIRNSDRRVILTKRGQAIYDRLAGP
jgi:hypothetical protein